MPPLTRQEDGLTKGTSCPSNCPMSGASSAAPACAWEGIVAATRSMCPRWEVRLTVHHIQGVKNECAAYISRNNFDALIGVRSEALAKEAFSRMDVHLDLNMTMIRPLDGLQQAEYMKEFGDIYKRLEKGLEPLLVN